MKHKICIMFAAPIGSSKSPIASYLSYNLNLPVFSSDAIRTEVNEDFIGMNEEEYIKRRNEREEEILKSGISFIYDKSIDRNWSIYSHYLTKYNYKWFIISIDLSKELLTKLYKAKGYLESLKRIDKLIEDHNNFLSKYSNEVNFRITDDTFHSRLKDSLSEVKLFLDKYE